MNIDDKQGSETLILQVLDETDLCPYGYSEGTDDWLSDERKARWLAVQSITDQASL